MTILHTRPYIASKHSKPSFFSPKSPQLFSISRFFSTILIFLIIIQVLNINKSISISNSPTISLLSSIIPSITQTNAQTIEEFRVESDITLFPTPPDYDYRSYYQGMINVACPKCLKVTWQIEIFAHCGPNLEDTCKSLPKITGATTTEPTLNEYFDTMRGSVTMWSSYLSSEDMCKNEAPIATSNEGPHTIFSCLNQEVSDDVSFSGHIRWTNGYYHKFLDDKIHNFTSELPIQYLKFAIIYHYTLFDDTKIYVNDKFEKVLPIFMPRSAGVVDYIAADEIKSNEFELFASFKTPYPFSSFALRPYGGLAQSIQRNSFSCTVNGIATTKWAAHSTIPNGNAFVLETLFFAHPFTINPRLSPRVPYSHLVSSTGTDTDVLFYIPANMLVTLKCKFIITSRFYADELPYGIAIQTGHMDIPGMHALRPQGPTPQQVREFIEKTSAVWFLPRIPVYSSLINSSPNAKSLQPVAVYYSGINYVDTTVAGAKQQQPLGGAMTLRFTLSQLDGMLTCIGDSTTRATSQILISTETYSNWSITSMRYTFIAPSLYFEKPEVLGIGYVDVLGGKRAGTTLEGSFFTFEGIQFCDALSRLNATAAVHNIKESVPMDIIVELSGVWLGKEENNGMEKVDNLNSNGENNNIFEKFENSNLNGEKNNNIFENLENSNSNGQENNNIFDLSSSSSLHHPLQSSLSTPRAEYQTPRDKSPYPFNVMLNLRQNANDYLGRSSNSYQPTSLTWSTNYQIRQHDTAFNALIKTVTNSTNNSNHKLRECNDLSIITMNISEKRGKKNFDKKNEKNNNNKNDNYFQIDFLQIKPLLESFRVLLLSFSSATYRFVPISPTKSHGQDSIPVLQDINIIEYNPLELKSPTNPKIITLTPYIINYPTYNGGLALSYTFKAGYTYILQDNNNNNNNLSGISFVEGGATTTPTTNLNKVVYLEYFVDNYFTQLRHYNTAAVSSSSSTTTTSTTSTTSTKNKKTPSIKMTKKLNNNNKIIDNKQDVHINLYAIPTTDVLNEYIDNISSLSTTTPYIQWGLYKIFDTHLIDYNMNITAQPSKMNHIQYNIDENDKIIYTTVHFGQYRIQVKILGRFTTLFIALSLLFIFLAVLAILGVYLWKKKHANLRKSALMEYTDHYYEDSVQEYMS